MDVCRMQMSEMFSIV